MSSWKNLFSVEHCAGIEKRCFQHDMFIWKANFNRQDDLLLSCIFNLHRKDFNAVFQAAEIGDRHPIFAVPVKGNLDEAFLFGT